MKKIKPQLLWAMDPFSLQEEGQVGLGSFFDGLAEAEKTQVEPVYVLAPSGFNWSGEFNAPWTTKYKPLAQAAAKKVVENLKSKLMAQPLILINRQSSLRSDIKKILDHARSKKSTLIIVQSHSRTGMSRLLLGSFAETLLLQSRVPVLVLKTHSHPPAQIRRVLFPTDFSMASHKALKKLLPRLQAWGASLTLFYKLPDPIEPVVQSGVFMAGGGWVSLSDYFVREAEVQKKKIAKLKVEAEKYKVPTSVVVESQPGLVTDAILRVGLPSQVDLIAMATQSGPVSSVLLGSVTRQVVREAKVPVLVFR